MRAIKKFPSSHLQLSRNEQKVLKTLEDAAEILAIIYAKQKNPRYPGANFYPHDATKEEIENAAKKSPAILDPYTIVERNKSGRLVAVPYRVKFQKELTKIAQLLRKAATLSKDTKLCSYLKARADDLLSDHYDKSNILWLKTEDSKIGCVIGAFDRYLDKFFFKKRAFMAWVGILDKKQTKEMDRDRAMILASERKFLPGAKRALVSRVKIRIEDTTLFSGLVADFLFIGNNLPSSADLYLIKEHGTLFTIFKPTTEQRFSRWIFPIFQALFPKDFQKEYSRKELLKAFLFSSILHESCHSLMRYEDAAARLEEFFPYFDEIYTDLLGIKGTGSLLLKSALGERDLETLLIIEVCHALYFGGALQRRPHLDPYATGSALFLDFLLKGGALRKSRGRFQLDFHRAFIATDQLSHILEYYLALGNRDEAKEFLKKFQAKKVFAKFTPSLKKVLAKNS